MNKLTKEQWSRKAGLVHNYKYDYSKTNYVHNKHKVIIICPEHGEFKQLARNHILGSGCKECMKVGLSNKYSLTLDKFIEKAIAKHGDRYDYSLVKYKNYNSIVQILCPIHGEFTQEASNHLYGNGCPKCNESKGEEKIRLFLEKNNIKYNTQEWFKDRSHPCINIETKSKLPFDFYLPEYNLCIEYDGEQHFKTNEYFGGKEEFIKLKNRDKIKNQYCINSNIKLLRIRFNQFKNIDKILEYILQNL